MLRVEYLTDRIEFGQQADLDKAVMQQLGVKFKSWGYERERRIFVSLSEAIEEGGLHFEPFSDTMRLREIILGAQCSLSCDMVRNSVEKHHDGVSTISARLAEKFFSIVPEEKTIELIDFIGPVKRPIVCPCDHCDSRRGCKTG
jgi:hypothetical protein